MRKCHAISKLVIEKLLRDQCDKPATILQLGTARAVQSLILRNIFAILRLGRRHGK